MANYFTLFSCLLPVGTAENVARALGLFSAMELELANDDETEIGFAVSEDDPGELWIRDEHALGDPEHVIAFVLRCAEALNLSGRWGFAWALTCSKPHLDGFGGGAQLLDLTSRRSLGWVECSTWLSAGLADTDGTSPN